MIQRRGVLACLECPTFNFSELVQLGQVPYLRVVGIQKLVLLLARPLRRLEQAKFTRIRELDGSDDGRGHRD